MFETLSKITWLILSFPFVIAYKVALGFFIILEKVIDKSIRIMYASIVLLVLYGIYSVPIINPVANDVVSRNVAPAINAVKEVVNKVGVKIGVASPPPGFAMRMVYRLASVPGYILANAWLAIKFFASKITDRLADLTVFVSLSVLSYLAIRYYSPIRFLL